MGADTRWGQAWENVSDRGSHLEIMTSTTSDTAKDACFLFSVSSCSMRTNWGKIYIMSVAKVRAVAMNITRTARPVS